MGSGQYLSHELKKIMGFSSLFGCTAWLVRSWLPAQRWNAVPQQRWQLQVLTTGPPGNSQIIGINKLRSVNYLTQRLEHSWHSVHFSYFYIFFYHFTYRGFLLFTAVMFPNCLQKLDHQILNHCSQEKLSVGSWKS